MIPEHIEIDPAIFLNVYDKLMADEDLRHWRKFARTGRYDLDGSKHGLSFKIIIPRRDLRDLDERLMLRMTFGDMVSVRFFYDFTNDVPEYYSHPSSDVFLKLENYNKENIEHHLTMLSLGIPVELEVA